MVEQWKSCAESSAAHRVTQGLPPVFNALVTQAVVEYTGRMAIEETYRDCHHHWAVRAAVVGLPTEAMVARLIEVVCLAYTVPMHLGQRVRVDSMGQQR